jgi:hypothetical protein
MKLPPLMNRLTCRNKVRAAHIYKQTEDLVLLTVEMNIMHPHVSWYSDGYYEHGKCITGPWIEVHDPEKHHGKQAKAAQVEFPRFAGWSIIHAAEWCRGSVLVIFEKWKDITC